MTREEERKQAGNEHVKHFFDSLDINIGDFPTDAIISYADFMQGAEWADEHPRKGLVDIDRACEWIGTHLLSVYREKVIDEFRKAMDK